MGIGEILSTALQLYRRHWRTLLTIAAVVVIPHGGHAALWRAGRVLLYLDLRARKESLTMEALRTDLQASDA